MPGGGVLHLEPHPDPRRALPALLGRLIPDLPPGRRVLVKPNWCARRTPVAGENTSAAFLEVLIGWFQERGAEVLVGHAALLTPPDRPYVGLAEQLRLAGCEGLLDRFPHVRFVDLETVPMQVVRSGEVAFLAPRLLAEVDLLVNCCRLKTHMMTGVSLGAKNLMGVPPDNEKLRMHRDGLDELVARFAHAVGSDLVLVEADVGMEGEGPHHGTEVEVGYHFGGDDLLAVDAAGCRLMGIDPAEVPHLVRLAALQGRPLPGLPSGWERHVRPFRRPRAWLAHGRRVRIWPGDSCSTCHVAAQAVEEGIRARPLRVGDAVAWADVLLRRGLDLYMGHQPEDRPPARAGLGIALGDCAADYARRWDLPHLPGCPVRQHAVRPALMELLRRLHRDGAVDP